MKWCATLVTAYGVPLAGDNDDPADDSAAIGLSGRGCMASCSSISLIRWYIYKNNNNTKYIHITYSILSVPVQILQTIYQQQKYQGRTFVNATASQRSAWARETRNGRYRKNRKTSKETNR